MTGYDGPTLRAVRESIGVPLRRIARQANMSHGHLSKVERGEHGRPVTPAVVAAYEKVTGVRLGEAAAALARQGEGLRGAPRRKTWTPGQLTDIRRRGFNASVAALTLGGPLGEPLTRLLDATGRPMTPEPPDLGDVEQLEHTTELFTTLDMRHGGGMMSQLVKYVLRWAVGMLDITVTVPVPIGRRLHAAVGAMAARAAWAAFDVDAHEAARSLFRLALYTAARASDPNLRAHVLADVAAQHNQLGYHDDALEIVRFGEGDERVDPPVQAVLHGVKARAYAATGDRQACRRHIGMAEEAYAEDSGGGGAGWVGRLRHPAHLYAATGHALSVLAHDTGEGNEHDRDEARERLTRAIDEFDHTTHARAQTLCITRLARLHLATGEVAEGVHWAQRAVADVPTVHSSRLVADLQAVRQTATAHADDPTVKELVVDIDALTSDDDEDAQPGGGTP